MEVANHLILVFNEEIDKFSCFKNCDFIHSAEKYDVVIKHQLLKVTGQHRQHVSVLLNVSVFAQDDTLCVCVCARIIKVNILMHNWPCHTHMQCVQ